MHPSNYRKKIVFLLVSLAMVYPLWGFAFGLGEIQVNSALDQPFDALIPITDTQNISPTSLKLSLAPETAYKNVGLLKDAWLSDLSFTVTGRQGQQLFARIQSVKPINQPVLTLLLTLNGPNSEITKEYTAFLNPSTYQPTSTIPNTSQISTTGPEISTYGPTTPQDNLWKIANQYPMKGMSSKQVMWGIFTENPNAFTNGNINGLKSGQILRLPSIETLQKGPDALSVEQNIQQQNNLWQDKNQTLVLPHHQSSELVDSQPDKDNLNQDLVPEKTLVTDKSSVVSKNVSDDSVQATISALSNEIQIAKEAMLLSNQANQTLTEEVAELKKTVVALHSKIKANSDKLELLRQHNQVLHQALKTAERENHRQRMIFIILGFLFLIVLFIWRFYQFFAEKINQFNSYSQSLNLRDKIPFHLPDAEDFNKLSQLVGTNKKSPETLNVLSETASAPPVNVAKLELLEEVEVYIAYHRYEKAESLLLTALALHPKQPEYILKLLEIYTYQHNLDKYKERLETIDVNSLSPALMEIIKKLQAEWDNYQQIQIDSTRKIDETHFKGASLDNRNHPMSISTEAHKTEESNLIEFEGQFDIELNSSPEPLESSLPTQPPPLGIVAEEVPEDLTQRTQMNLDLAEAYLEMGDKEEALILLDALRNEDCSEEQKERLDLLTMRLRGV